MKSGRKYDIKLFRLVRILNQLDAGKPVSTKEMAREFSVSVRTAQRDINLLDSAGFPVYEPGRGQYMFVDGFSLKKVALSREEASLLAFFYDIAGSLGVNFKKVYSGILHKVLNPQMDTPYFVKMPDTKTADQKVPFWKDLESAVEESQKVEILYAKGKEDNNYRVCPLKLINYEGFWYLLASLDKSRQIRKFRLGQIKEVRALEQHFSVPGNLRALLRNSVNIWFTEKRDKRVVLRVDGVVAGFFKRKTYFPLQKIAKENKDGSLIIETKVGQFEEIIPTIMHWIPSVKVISPISLRQKIQNILKRYQNGLSDYARN